MQRKRARPEEHEDPEVASDPAFKISPAHPFPLAPGTLEATGSECHGCAKVAFDKFSPHSCPLDLSRAETSYRKAVFRRAQDARRQLRQVRATFYAADADAASSSTDSLFSQGPSRAKLARLDIRFVRAVSV